MSERRECLQSRRRRSLPGTLTVNLYFLLASQKSPVGADQRPISTPVYQLGLLSIGLFASLCIAVADQAVEQGVLEADAAVLEGGGLDQEDAHGRGSRGWWDRPDVLQDRHSRMPICRIYFLDI